MNLAMLAYEMKAAGIKSLALELQDESSLPMPPGNVVERPNPAPGDLPTERETEPPKDPRLCVAPNCQSERGGLFGGIAGEFCREHALARAGVKR